MKCAVVYFSLTGNTEKVARKIQEGVKQAAGNCDLLNIRNANPRELYQYDLIGIGTPAWGGPAKPAKEFINEMWSVGGKHSFLFCTHGTLPYYFFSIGVPMLKERGLQVIGWAKWYGDGNQLWHCWPYPTAGHPDAIDLKEAEDFGREMVERSRRISSGETGLIPSLQGTPPPDVADVTPKAATWDIEPSDIKYHPEKCRYPKCRLCMDNCPVFAIDLSLEPRVIASEDRCLGHCGYCAMICPTGAIEVDEWLRTQAPSYLKLQQHLTIPNLAKQEAEGTFRRLVPIEDVKFETYLGMVCSKHPKWIIGKGPNIK
jgi:flavodoxin/Fe-S-cluster-containing hydrogenase component 2